MKTVKANIETVSSKGNVKTFAITVNRGWELTKSTDSENGIKKQNIMTSKEIFKNGQVLTIGEAKKLIGKYIYVTNAEYCNNEPTVRRVLVDPISEWDAAREDHTVEGYANRQEYWLSYMTPKQIERMKNCYHIGVNELGNYEGGTLSSDDNTPFYGSDADREIYYLIDESK